jgi:hypothetical protein
MKTLLRFIFPASFLFSFAGAQDLSQAVTYESNAASAKKVIAELSALSKVPMEAAPLTANEVLVIHVKDVPLTTVMKKIAEVTSGDWEKDGELWRLIPSNGRRSLQASAEHYMRVNAIQKGLDRLMKPPAKSKTPVEDDGIPMAAADMPLMGGRSGAGAKAIITILSQGRITANTLAGIPEGGRMVFSSHPTRMQTAINFNLGPLVLNLVEQHNKNVEAMREAEANRPPKTKEEEQMEAWAKSFGFDRKPELIKGNASKLLLVASRTPMMEGINLQLKLFDDQGYVATTGNQMIMVGEGMFGGFTEMMPGATKPAPAPAGDKPIKFSARTQSMIDFFKTMSNPMMVSKADSMNKELREVLLRPDLHEPLSFIHGEAVLAVAKEKNLQLVASLPDEMMSFFGMMVEGVMGGSGYTINAYLKRLENGEQTKAENKDGWLTIVPTKPAENRRIRADRVALANFINMAQEKGVPSLDDYAAYALKSEPPMESPGSMMYLMLFAPNTIQQGFGGMTNWDMLRFYGSLSIAQKQNLQTGGQISFGTLNQQQANLVRKMVFGANARLQVLDGKAEKTSDNPFLDMARAFMPGDSRGLQDEPTEVMPNGLPGNGYVVMNLDKGYFTTVPSDQAAAPSSMFGALGADEMAMLKYFREDPQFSAFSGFMPAMDKFKVGDRETLNFQFFVASNTVVKETLKNDRMSKDAKVVAYAQLPAELRERIEKRVEAFKKNPLPFGQMMGGGGGFPPPPPLP